MLKPVRLLVEWLRQQGPTERLSRYFSFVSQRRAEPPSTGGVQFVSIMYVCVLLTHILSERAVNDFLWKTGTHIHITSFYV